MHPMIKSVTWVPANLFDAVKPTDQNVIEACTVRVTCLERGRKVTNRYSHTDKDMAMSGAANAVARIDTMRSPRASAPYKLGTDWNVDVSYYGLD